MWQNKIRVLELHVAGPSHQIVEVRFVNSLVEFYYRCCIGDAVPKYRFGGMNRHSAVLWIKQGKISQHAAQGFMESLIC